MTLGKLYSAKVTCLSSAPRYTKEQFFICSPYTSPW